MQTVRWCCLCSGQRYLLRQVEGGDAQRPEAAEHGEEGQTQVVLGGHQRKTALTVHVAEVLHGRVLRVKHRTVSKIYLFTFFIYSYH